MPRTNVILNAFTGGEVSPEVWGRTNTDQWPTFVEVMENMFPNPRGGAQSRAGLHRVLPTKFPQQNSRLIPFIFSSTQSYVLEMGDQYIRFYRDYGYVENVEAVKSFIGDGSSKKYLYPHPEVAEADIEVYKNGTKLTTPADYTIAPANITTSQIDGYDTPASWDLNYNLDDDDTSPAPSPWVLDGGGTAVSPVDGEPILRQADVDIARGSLVDVSFDVSSFTKVSDNFAFNLISDGSLGEDFSEVVFVTMSGRDGWGHALVDFAVTFQAANPNTSDVVTAKLEYGNATDGWTTVVEYSEIVDSGGSTFARIDELVTGPFKEGDQFRIMAKQANDLAANIETIATSNINVDAIVDYYADLKTWTINAQSEAAPDIVTKLDGFTGTASFSVTDVEVTNNYPLQWLHETDPGVSVTLENLSVINKREGWEITFTTAPSIADVVVVLDGSSASGSQIQTADGDIINRIYLSDGVNPQAVGEIYEIESPFKEDEIDDVYFTQANDQMFFCHYKHKPWRLTRYNAYDWRFEQPKFTGAPWEDGQYSPVAGYPRVVTFFQERLYFAATLEKPQTIWGSRTADFYEFTLPGDTAPYKPDDPVEYTIAAYTHEQIEWMASERVLVIGTSGTEHRLAPDQYVATDRPPKVSRMSAYGGAHIIPVFMGNLTVFIQTSSLEVRTYEQTAQSVIEKWTSLDLTWMAKHMFEEGCKEVSYALTPNSLLNIVTNDGKFRTMTYDPSQGDTTQVGWARHPTQGKYHSHCTIPEGFGHVTWCIVEREENDPLNPGTMIKNKNVEFFDPWVYHDSSLTYPPDYTGDDPAQWPPTNSVAGLDHLEGQEVSIKADDATHPPRTVVNGQITLNARYGKIDIGLPYNKRLKLQKFASAGDPANMQGMQGRWVEVWLRMINSAYPMVDGYMSAERRPATPMDTAEPIITGDVKAYHLGFDRNKQITINQELPFPLFITAVYGVLEVDPGG